MAETMLERLTSLGVVKASEYCPPFPHRVEADYLGDTHIVQYGAFLGWDPDADFGHRLIEAAKCDRAGSLASAELVLIWHQAGGHACEQTAFALTPVQITPRYSRFASDLCRDYYHRAQGQFYYALTEDYRKLFDGYNERLALGGLDTLPFFPVLERKDFDVRASGPIVMEALYPIPGTQQNIGAFVDQAELVMTRLRPLLLDPALQKTLTIYILADNSD